MNKTNETPLVKLLSVIIVLLVIIIIALSATISKTNKAREDAFKIEATKVVEAGLKAKDNFADGSLSIPNDSESCNNGTQFCISVKKLIELGLYDEDEKEYSGKLEIDYTENDNPQLGLYLKKNDEFKIIGGIWKDYSKNGSTTRESWDESYERCECE